MVKSMNLALRFFLELGALAGLAYWGFRTGQSLPVKLLLGAGVPLAAAVLWGVFRVNNDPGPAPVAVPGPLRLLIELLVFGGAVAGLYFAGQPLLALVFALLVIFNNALMVDRLRFVWRQ